MDELTWQQAVWLLGEGKTGGDFGDSVEFARAAVRAREKKRESWSTRMLSRIFGNG